MDTRSRLEFVIKSILITRYITEFSKLEKLILSIFKKDIVKVEHKYKNKLFFYYGVYAGNSVYYDFEANCISISGNIKYDSDEVFASLNLNKIINFERRESLIKSFNFNVDSVIRKTIGFTFNDCCKKLINMRNKVAHEMDTISFQESKDVIERLPLEFLKEYNYEYIEEYDISNMDDVSFALFSNIVYIREIINKLESCNKADTSFDKRL